MHRMSLLALAILSSPLAAQAPYATSSSASDRAAGTITEADVGHRIRIIADDSMMGRDTPSRGLEMTAQYVADEFRRFGLKPGGDRGTWFQRYDIMRWKFEPSQSHVGFMVGSTHKHAEFALDGRYLTGRIPQGEVGGPVVLLGGPLDSAVVTPEEVRGRVVLVVVDRTASNMPGPVSRLLLRTLPAAGPVGIVMISNRDSARFAVEMSRQNATRLTIESPEAPAPPVLELHERAIGDVFRQAGIDLAAMRASATFIKREIPGLRVMLDLKSTVVERNSAPNTIGILEGTDPVLKNEYLVFSAHMDHIGIRSGAAPDSINNGADDDGSGTVGIMELAEAFSRPGARPRRSILFLTVSGEEKGLWGSDYFTTHPTVPLESMVADLNIDMIGRNWKDTIVAIGKEHSDLGATLARVNAAHPELHMTAIDDRWPSENFYSRSDHYNFARRGVPILFFFNGTHEDYHRVTDSPDKIDGEKESRILKLLYYLGQEIANNPERPKWNPESYRRIVGGSR